MYRKQKIGTVKDDPRLRDAEKAVQTLRAKINSEARSRETVTELINHYKEHELTEDSGKRFSKREVYSGFLKLHIGPTGGRSDRIR